MRARAEFLNPDFLIAPGQFGTIRIPGSPEYEAILIPDEAIVTDQSQKLVMTRDRGQQDRAARDPPRTDASSACASCGAASSRTTGS